MSVLRYSLASTPAPDRGVPLARDDGGLHYCRPCSGAGENSGATKYAMKSMIGIVLAFALGFACRAFGIPSPAPTSNPWRIARDDDDDRLHRRRSLDGLASSTRS